MPGRGCRWGATGGPYPQPRRLLLGSDGPGLIRGRNGGCSGLRAKISQPGRCEAQAKGTTGPLTPAGLLGRDRDRLGELGANQPRRKGLGGTGAQPFRASEQVILSLGCGAEKGEQCRVERHGGPAVVGTARAATTATLRTGTGQQGI